MMQTTAIELARFRIKPDLTDEAFEAKIQETTAALSTYSGFVSRQVGKTINSEYFDIVVWQDMSSASAAAKIFGSDRRAKSFISSLDFAWDGNWLKHLSVVSNGT
jgi:hypothetical protein